MAKRKERLEPRVVALAEQMGRFVGSVQAKAERLVTRSGPRGATKEPLATQAAPERKGRSGGVVDAPGKKHRKPVPADPKARRQLSPAANMSKGRTAVAAARRRGRG